MSTSSAFGRHVDSVVVALQEHGLPSVRNLLVTVFGDALRPRGSAVAVRSLATLLAPLDVTERSVRTSLTRLAGDDLVVARRRRNRSFYAVHPNAAPIFERAEERIYHPPHREWDGMWTLVVVDGGVGEARQRARLRRELELSGLGTIAPNVMASPVASAQTVQEVADHVGLRDALLVTRAETVSAVGFISDADLAERCAPLDLLAERYDEVVGWFTPVADALARGIEPTPQEAFTVRLLLVATYRRVVLADPMLPAVMLPGSWSGGGAYVLVGGIYRRVYGASERWVTEVCETPSGRFGTAVDTADRFAE